jgi:uncharacterized protein (TIGR00730 family)
MKSVCVFCGSRPGRDPVHAAAAAALGGELARRGLTLVYGGGRVGLMGVVADAARAAGGPTVGVIPDALALKEVAHAGLTELHVVGSMHERKALMADRADAFAALPGGYGTCDELFEILTWAQLGLHQKPVGLLNTNGFFDGLLAWLGRLADEGFLTPSCLDRLLVADTPARLLDRLAAFRPPPGGPPVKWLAPDER